MQEKRLLTVTELSSLLSMTPGAIYMLIARCQIPYLKIGRRVRFDPAQIEAWLQNQKVAVGDER
jgi:excisionase family DNA binding protein